MLCVEVPRILRPPRSSALAAELHDRAQWIFDSRDVQNVLGSQRFKVKPVGNIEISAHGFRVGIHHDGFHARIPQCHRGVYAAVIEFNALSDAVGSAAQDHDFRARART